MAGFFNKLKGAGNGISKVDSNASLKNKKEEPVQELTPLEKLLQNAGPVREDGSDKFFGLENFGNTCYCNSIIQALYYSEPFREHVVKYPFLPAPDSLDGQQKKVHVTIRPPIQPNGTATVPGKGQKPTTSAQALKQRQVVNGQVVTGGQPMRPEDKPDSPEYKKKQSMIRGPVLELAQENPDAYGMEECTFTGLKDIFTALIESNTRTGVLSPQRFLDIFKRDNELFRNSMHQDAHEFYGLVLNDVIANVEANAKRIQEKDESTSNGHVTQATKITLGASGGITSQAVSGRTPGTGWVHDIFEGVLVSETRCLTCETASQRDETFLDLSIDLEEHSSVTSCLQNFSAEEMLCERNKFHCDHCGGLQEAEKRMKIKKLPKVLALHLKRFKYTEDYSRLQKLFHRVVYPYHLRMFNTTDDAVDPDRMYELYAVVIHIGSNAYHGHYVAVIKTKDRGWLLFDDEMVEPVDKHFVRNFFGDRPGQACAYVLFYQEVEFDAVREEMDAEGPEEVRLANLKADTSLVSEQVNGSATVPLSKLNTQPLQPVEEDHDPMPSLSHAQTAPGDIASTVPLPMSPTLPDHSETHPMVAAPPPAPAVITNVDEAATIPPKSKDEKSRDKKEQKAQEKARKAAEKEQAQLAEKQRLDKQTKIREAQKSEQEQLQKALQESRRIAAEEEKQRKREMGDTPSGVSEGGEKSFGFLNRASRGSKSMTRKSFAFLNKVGDKGDKAANGDKGSDKSDKSEKGESSSVSAADGPGSSSHPPQQQQNGGGSHSPTTQISQETPEKHDKPLKERFSFGLGRKKSTKFRS
ncbi:hypothetical protein B0H63DRAFT_386405 [Podospora didyma]|uniref:Ubiquitin carboxyl-terminal hydrolase n=1 Tax=Podospora didyma TaxID=330526 RepID=A0AAE0P6V4_9PEZI|nr:hypothetical protein B0H63DRAFT_386405 [Podospora didyma]